MKNSGVRALAAPFGGRLTFFPSGSAHGRRLSEQTIEANRPQAYRDPAQLGVPGRVQFILRVSYLADYPNPASLRMPLPRFLRSA